MRTITTLRTSHSAGPVRCLAIVLLTATLAAAPAFWTVAPAAVAQTRGPVQRTVHGKVEDKSGAPIKGAVVYLQDSRSSAVKSAISEDDGSYRFVQLSQNTDYTLWAKSNGKQSKNRTISSFDSKNDFEIGLTIDQ